MIASMMSVSTTPSVSDLRKTCSSDREAREETSSFTTWPGANGSAKSLWDQLRHTPACSAGASAPLPMEAAPAPVGFRTTRHTGGRDPHRRRWATMPLSMSLLQRRNWPERCQLGRDASSPPAPAGVTPPTPSPGSDWWRPRRGHPPSGPRFAERSHRPVLERMEQVALGGRRGVRDLVEEQRSAMGRHAPAGRAGHARYSTFISATAHRSAPRSSRTRSSSCPFGPQYRFTRSSAP